MKLFQFNYIKETYGGGSYYGEKYLDNLKELSHYITHDRFTITLNCTVQFMLTGKVYEVFADTLEGDIERIMADEDVSYYVALCGGGYKEVVHNHIKTLENCPDGSTSIPVKEFFNINFKASMLFDVMSDAAEVGKELAKLKETYKTYKDSREEADTLQVQLERSKKELLEYKAKLEKEEDTDDKLKEELSEYKLKVETLKSENKSLLGTISDYESWKDKVLWWKSTNFLVRGNLPTPPRDKK